jgi:hypothetical protein
MLPECCPDVAGMGVRMSPEYAKKGFRTVRTQVADIGNGFVMDDNIMEKEIVLE